MSLIFCVDTSLRMFFSHSAETRLLDSVVEFLRTFEELISKEDFYDDRIFLYTDVDGKPFKEGLNALSKTESPSDFDSLSTWKEIHEKTDSDDTMYILTANVCLRRLFPQNGRNHAKVIYLDFFGRGENDQQQVFCRIIDVRTENYTQVAEKIHHEFLSEFLIIMNSAVRFACSIRFLENIENLYAPIEEVVPVGICATTVVEQLEVMKTFCLDPLDSEYDISGTLLCKYGHMLDDVEEPRESVKDEVNDHRQLYESLFDMMEYSIKDEEEEHVMYGYCTFRGIIDQYFVVIRPCPPEKSETKCFEITVTKYPWSQILIGAVFQNGTEDDFNENANDIEGLFDPSYVDSSKNWHTASSMGNVLYRMIRALRKLPERTTILQQEIENMTSIVGLTQNRHYAKIFADVFREESKTLGSMHKFIADEAAKHFDMIYRNTAE